MQTTLHRSNTTRSEIQWRGAARDAMVIFAFTLVGVVLGSLDKIGVGALLAPIPLVYLASIWFHHDLRIGSLGRYLQDVIEPAMKEYDGLQGLQDWLNAHETARSYRQRYHFTSVMSRLLFPSLQGILLAMGLGIYVHKGTFNTPVVVLVTVGAVLILGSIVLTAIKVRHIR